MRDGVIVTFYSYKGGVGRTSALANIGALLNQWGYKVLCIDWDLEAPGLHLYFQQWMDSIDQKGLVDLIQAQMNDENPKWEEYTTRVNLPRTDQPLYLMMAGKQDTFYVKRMQSLDWVKLYDHYDFGNFLEQLREEWKEAFDFILVDSRTGITDIGGICTVQLPDLLVLLLTANNQNVSGAKDVINRAKQARNNLPFDRGKLLVLPVITHFERRVEYELAQKWTEIIATEIGFLYSEWSHKDISVNELLNFIRVPYVPYWSYGERLPVIEKGTDDSEDIGFSLETLAALIARRFASSENLVRNRDAFVAAANKKTAEKTLPPTWNVPYKRDPYFIGRENILDNLKAAFTSRKSATSTQAILGLGGIGKTHLVVEYAYRFANEYEIVWWIRAENKSTLDSDYVALAQSLNLVESNALETQVTIDAMRSWLGKNAGWLLIFDNAQSAEELRGYLPQTNTGHILITSRQHNWQRLASSIEINVWSSHEAVNFLCGRTGQNDIPTAKKLAEILGYLPLALVQAAAYIEAAGKSLSDYLQLYEQHRQKLWHQTGGINIEYSNTLATTWELSFHQASAYAPAAIELLNICAFFAPEDIPRSLLLTGVQKLLKSAALSLADPLIFDDAIIALRKVSLIEARQDTLSIHRLVQAVTRDRLSADNKKRWAAIATQIITAVFPSKSDDVSFWSTSACLLPHALTATKHAQEMQVALEEISQILNRVGLYYYAHANYVDAESLFQRALKISEQQLGVEHPDITEILNNLAKLFLIQGKYGEAELIYRRALMIFEKQMGPEHPYIARSLSNLAELLYVLGKYADAEQLYRRALAIDKKVFGPEHPNVATSLNNLATLLHAQGQYTEAEADFRRALAIREKQFGSDRLDVAVCLNNLATLLEARSQYAEAEALYRRALAIREKQLGPEHPDVAQSLGNLAKLLKVQGQYSQAEELNRRALEIREKHFGTEHPDVAIILNNMAELLRVQGKYSEAEPLSRRALEIREKCFGPDHPSVSESLNNLAILHYQQGEYTEAELFYRRALAIDEKSLGTDHPNVATTLNNLAALLKALGHYVEAESLLNRALAIRENRFGPSHPDVATSLNNLAFLLYDQGRYAEAEPLYRRSLAIREEKLGSEHPAVAESLNNLAELLRVQGEYATAEPLYRRALEIWEQHFGRNHPHVATVLNNLALLLYDQGQYAAAEPLYRRALGIWEKSRGPDHPDTKTARENLASLLAQMQSPKPSP